MAYYPLGGLEQISDLEQVRFCATDFDGTKFETSEAGDGILSVDQAYAYGIDQLVGAQAVDAFMSGGGHNHRTPAEIVASLNHDMSQPEIEQTAARLVDAKIEVLMDQIGRPLNDGAQWPRPTEGFVSFWETLHSYNEQHGLLVTTADISAGHVPIIERIYDCHGLKKPDLIVTDDTLVEELGMDHVPAADRAKPNPLILRVAVSRWAGRLGVAFDGIASLEGDLRQRVIYCGDSPEKDGAMAANYGVEFELIAPGQAAEAWQRTGLWLGIERAAREGTLA